MSRGIIVAGMFFGLSAILNVLCFHRLSEYKDELSSARAAAPSRETAKQRTWRRPDGKEGLNSALFKEIQALREDFNAFRTATPQPLLAAQPSSEPARTSGIFPACFEKDPEISRLFSQMEEEERFWGTLKKLDEIRDALGYEKYRSCVIDLTQEFLGIADSPEGFRKTATQTGADLSQILSRWQEERAAARDDQGIVNRDHEIAANAECEKDLARLTSGLCGYFDAGYKHRRFARDLDRWLSYLLPADASGTLSTYCKSR